MIERILQIIVYVVQEINRHNVLSDVYLNYLNKQGFTDAEISTAISWLAYGSDIEIPEINNKSSFRILCASERELFTEDAYSDLIQLNTLGILTNEQIEFIIERADLLELPKIDKNILNSIVTAFFMQRNPNPKGAFNGRTMLSGSETIN